MAESGDSPEKSPKSDRLLARILHEGMKFPGAPLWQVCTF